MIKDLTFAKLANKWYIVLPWYEGDIEDLQMVCGADLLLETLAKGTFIVDVKVSDKYIGAGGNYKLTLIDSDDTGATYEAEHNNFYSQVWLCNVTKYVLGDFLPYIYIRKVM